MFKQNIFFPLSVSISGNFLDLTLQLKPMISEHKTAEKTSKEEDMWSSASLHFLHQWDAKYACGLVLCNMKCSHADKPTDIYNKIHSCFQFYSAL